MYTIGQFSRLSQIPVKTLRYYDAIGLLRPARIDGSTGYRYYVVGPKREIYLDDGYRGRRESVTEIQFPIADRDDVH